MKRAAIFAASLPAFLLSGAYFAQAADATCEQPAATQPRLQRTSPNKIVNPHVTGGTNWTLVSGAAIDATVSRTKDGSGSLDISVPGSAVQSSPIPVVPGMTYTFSAYLESAEWPALAYMLINIRDSSQKFIATANSGYQGTTAANQWQEIAVTYTARPGEAFVNVQVGRNDASRSPSVSGKMWVDDLYFGEGISFDQPFSPKIPFDGGMVKVDELGNYTVSLNGDWSPYFPFCVYFGSSPDFQAFSDQGFNCTMRSNVSLLGGAKNAVSAFNPNGMMSAIDITGYLLGPDGIHQPSPSYNDLPALRSMLASLMQSPALSSVLAFYWDNEEYNQYDVPHTVTDLIKQADTANGVRLHPIYMLDGVQADSRVYAQLEDVVGDYLRDGPSVSGALTPSTLERFPISQNLEGQSRPVTFGTVSEEFYPEGLRRKVYQGLIAGVKGVAYFRDGDCQADYNGPPGACVRQMSLRPSWTEFPALRQEIEQLLPLLREQRWTAWTATSSDPSLQFGTRDHHCDGYLIVVNPSGNDVTSTFTISGLSYTPAAATDYFMGLSGRIEGNATPVAAVSQGKFTVTLPAYQTAVYHLSRDSAPTGPKPVVFKGGVINALAFGGGETVSPGDWIEIYGSNLSPTPTPRGWAGADFRGKLAPTALDGVRVSIGGRAAYIDYISPGQINAQVPDAVGPGPMKLLVTNSVGTSDPYVVNVVATRGALLAPAAFQVGGRQYVAALHVDGTFVLPNGALPGLTSRPANPGETITLYGLGFGPVTPQTWAGTIASGATTLVRHAQILFGNSTTAISYQGLSPNAVGLYQFNVVVPDIADGEAIPLTVSLDGNTTGQILFTAVRSL